MKEKKIIFLACCCITILSLGYYVLLYLYPCNKFLGNNILQNIISGIFTGSILSLYLSIIEYFAARKNILEHFCTEILRYSFHYRKIDYLQIEVPLELLCDFLHECHINERNKELELKRKHKNDNDSIIFPLCYDAKNKLKEWIWKDLSKTGNFYCEDKTEFLEDKVNNLFLQHTDSLKKICMQIVAFRDYKFSNLNDIFNSLDFLLPKGNIRKSVDSIYKYHDDVRKRIFECAFHAKNYLDFPGVSPSVITEKICQLQDDLFDVEYTDFYKKVFFAVDYNSYVLTYELLRKLKHKNSLNKPQKKHFLKCAFTYSENLSTSFVKESCMTILDLYNTKHNCYKTFKLLDKELNSSITLHEQKQLVYHFYEDLTVSRVALIGRRNQLNRIIQYNFDWVIEKSFGLFCSLSIGFICGSLNTLNIFKILMVLLLLIVVFFCSVFYSRKSNLNHKASLYEISLFEIDLINKILAENSEHVFLTNLSLNFN